MKTLKSTPGAASRLDLGVKKSCYGLYSVQLNHSLFAQTSSVENGTYAADSAMSSPNTSESQTDNCADSEAISLNQPVTTLPLHGKLADWSLRPGRSRQALAAPHDGRQPNKKFRMYTHVPGWSMNPKGLDSKHCQRVWKAVCSTARQGSLIITRRSAVGSSPSMVAVVAACLSAASHCRITLTRQKLSKHPRGCQRPAMVGLRFVDAYPPCLRQRDRLKGKRPCSAVWKDRGRTPVQGFRLKPTRSHRPAKRKAGARTKSWPRRAR